MDYEYEDIELSEAGNVESFEDFYNGNIESEYDEYIMQKYLKPCSNCGELVNRKYLKSGSCNLCNTSDKHKDYRAKQSNSNHNFRFIDNLMNSWDSKGKDV